MVQLLLIRIICFVYVKLIVGFKHPMVALLVIGIGKLSDIIFYVEKPKTPGYSVEIEQVASKELEGSSKEESTI